MCMRVSLLVNWSPVELLLKTVPHPVVNASVVIVNEGFPVSIQWP